MAREDKAQEAFDNFVQLWTTGTTEGRRAPVLRRPDEVGLDYEDVFFPSMDGVPLEGWFIPADSDKLIIHNHFLPGNRYGYQGICPSSAAWADSKSTSCPIQGPAQRGLQRPRLRHPQPRNERPR